jgi:hypothetical protein
MIATDLEGSGLVLIEERLRKTTKNPNEDRWCPERDSNQAHPESERGAFSPFPCYLLHAVLFFDPEDGGVKFLR